MESEMKISKIKIQNYRSIKKAEFETSSFNVFVGKNNHGKTNIFRAVEWFYSGKEDVKEIRNVDIPQGDEVYVEITFSGVQEGLRQISNEENQTKLKNILKESDIMVLRRSSSTPKDRFLLNFEKNEWKKQPCGVDSAFNNCIPKFEFVEATKNLKDVSSFSSKTPIGQILSGVIGEILEKDESYRSFRNAFENLFQSEGSGIQAKLRDLSDKVRGHLQQQFPDCSKVEFSVEEPSFDELLKNFFTRVNDGVETDATDKGDGMQRALMLAIIKTHADFRREDSMGKAFIFFIDEAELHLHPSAQRQLKTALLELSGLVDQVFINTHSSVMMVDENIEQTVLCVDKTTGDTKIEKIDKMGKQNVIFQLLGGNPSDLLLPSNFLIVEGPSEFLFLQKIIHRFYPHKKSIQIIPARGDHNRSRQNMDAINLVFQPLSLRAIYKEKLAILCDKPDPDKQASFERFKSSNSFLESNNQLWVLPVGSLEEYYPLKFRSIIPQRPTGEQKVDLAKTIGEEITKAEFETEMKIFFDALSFAMDKAFN